MSILNYLSEYTKEYMPPSVKWREKRVWHRTRSGEMHFVKVKSLSPEEQMKYKPIDLVNKDKRASKLNRNSKMKKIEAPGLKPTDMPTGEQKPIEGEMFDFYYGVKDESNYNEFEEDELIKATLDSATAIDMEDDEGLHIVFAQNVPIDAVKEYLDEEGEWKKIEIEDKTKKAEFIEFSENDYFKLDLYKYKDTIKLELQNDDDDEMEENIKEYEKYLLEKQVDFLIDNNMITLLKEEVVDPKVVELAKQIGKKLGLIYDGFIDFSDIDISKESKLQKYLNTANYTDPLTKSSLTINIKDFITSLKNGWEKLTHLRKSYNVNEPPKLEGI